MFVGVSVIEILLFNQKTKKMKNMANLLKLKLQVLHLFYKIFFILSDVISFQHVSTSMLVEVKLSGFS